MENYYHENKYKNVVLLSDNLYTFQLSKILITTTVQTPTPVHFIIQLV
jgi:hypothetical protein